MTKIIKDITKVAKATNKAGKVNGVAMPKNVDLSLDEINAEIKRLTELKRAHADYEVRKPKQHTVAKNRDIELILNGVCGRNAVLTKIKKLVADKSITPSTWTDKEFNLVQFNFALRGTKQFEMFLSKDPSNKMRSDWTNGSIKVRDAVNQLIKVATMSQGYFAKAQASK